MSIDNFEITKLRTLNDFLLAKNTAMQAVVDAAIKYKEAMNAEYQPGTMVFQEEDACEDLLQALEAYQALQPTPTGERASVTAGGG